MAHGWTQVKRYTLAGWKSSSARALFLLLTCVALLSAWSSAPFWLTFTSLLPFLLLYFPLAGFMGQLLDSDWEDWNPY